jgi:hypothetical protein
VKKNRRYYSSSRSSKRSSPATRFVLSLSLLGCVAIAAVCGRALDQRQRLAMAGTDPSWENGRASLSLPPTEQESNERRVRQQVEHLSGVPGRPLLSSERWQAIEPILIDGVNVSDMFAQPFVLKRSLANGFRTESVSLQASWQRPDTYLDLVLGQTSNGAVMMRFAKDGVRAFLRSHSGISIPGESVATDVTQGCERYEISVTTSDVTVSCGDRKILGVAYPSASEGMVSIASNLAAQEVSVLSIKGMLGESKTEDNA